MRQSTTNMTHEPPTESRKAEDKVNLEDVKIKDYRRQFVYQPSQILLDSVKYTQLKNTDEYLKDYHSGLMLQRPEYEKEVLVFDKTTNKWKLVKEEEMYKY